MSDKKHGPIGVLRESFAEILPSGKIDKVDVFGLPAELPPELCCDCCMEHGTRFKFIAHRGFCVKFPPRDRREFLSGTWAFCQKCHVFFTARDRKSLVDRVSRINPMLMRFDLEILYEILFDVVYGEFDDWEVGMSIPTGARDEEKYEVRDLGHGR